MFIELILAGSFVGVLSGFFGIGGGMILVPILMLIGFDIKQAIAISVVQMFFSSLFGSYLNYKKGNLKLNEGIFVGIGGMLGALIGATLTELLPQEYLAYALLALVLYALYKVAFSKKPEGAEEKSLSPIVLFIVGFFIGIISIMLGVGGSILLTPILVGFLHYSTKKAASASLFFVVFSSISGVVYKFYNHIFDNLHLDLKAVFAVAIASLIGVVLGIKLKEIIKDTHHKAALIALYLVIVAILVDKIFF
jgi:uncharacterized membrane protein YfcA